jgi:hypothetical protein
MQFCKSIFLKRKKLHLRAAMHSTREECISVECTRGRENSKQKINMYALKRALFEEKQKKTTLGKITPSAEQLQLGEESFFSQQQRN